MKRSEMLDKIRSVLINELDYDYIIGLDRMVLEEIEEAGMLPPTQAPSLVEDTRNGGIKHGPCQRIWDEE